MDCGKQNDLLLSIPTLINEKSKFLAHLTKQMFSIFYNNNTLMLDILLCYSAGML